MRKTQYIALLPALLLLGSCHKEEINGCGEPAPEGYRVFIRSLAHTEPFSSDSPEPRLLSVDNEGQVCANYQLLTTLQRNGNQLRLTYRGVREPDFCLTSTGYAQSLISLRNLDPQVYQLEITVRQRRTTGTLDLTVTPARLTIADTTVATVR